MPEGVSYGVFIFSFRDCAPVNAGCAHWTPEVWRLDAQAAMLKATELEGIDLTKIVPIGSSIDADGAADGYAWLNEQEPGSCQEALLHDVGKIGIPDSILFKSGPLTAEQWGIMRQHPKYARDLLYPIPYLHGALDIPYCHHEKWGGSGYPRVLEGEAIPLAALIFAVADVFDALTCERPYRPAWSKGKALERIYAHAGTHFDPKVIEVLRKLGIPGLQNV